MTGSALHVPDRGNANRSRSSSRDLRSLTLVAWRAGPRRANPREQLCCAPARLLRGVARPAVEARPIEVLAVDALAIEALSGAQLTVRPAVEVPRSASSASRRSHGEARRRRGAAWRARPRDARCGGALFTSAHFFPIRSAAAAPMWVKRRPWRRVAAVSSPPGSWARGCGAEARGRSRGRGREFIEIDKDAPVMQGYGQRRLAT
jgi:hypothetical protein